MVSWAGWYPVVSFFFPGRIIYYMPLTGMLITLALYALLTTDSAESRERMVTAVFTCGRICYYWVSDTIAARFGKFPGRWLPD